MHGEDVLCCRDSLIVLCRSVEPLALQLRLAAKQRKGNSFDGTSIERIAADFMQNKQREEISRPAGGLLFQLRRSAQQPPCTTQSNNRKQRHTPALRVAARMFASILRPHQQRSMKAQSRLECFVRCSVRSAIPTRKVKHVNDPWAFSLCNSRSTSTDLCVNKRIKKRFLESTNSC